LTPVKNSTKKVHVRKTKRWATGLAMTPDAPGRTNDWDPMAVASLREVAGWTSRDGDRLEGRHGEHQTHTPKLSRRARANLPASLVSWAAVLNAQDVRLPAIP